LIKSYSKDIYDVRKDYILNKCCSFELSIHHRIWGVKWYTTVFNIENNNLHFLSIKSGSCDTEN